MTGSSRDGSDGKMVEPLAETAWESAPVDPDPCQNLGYELSDWEVLSPSRESDQVVFLPEDEEMLRDEAFVIVARESVCSLDQQR